MDAFKDKVTLCLQFQNGSENKSVCVCVCVYVHLTFNLFSPRVLKDFDGEIFTCVF